VPKRGRGAETPRLDVRTIQSLKPFRWVAAPNSPRAGRKY